MFMNQPDSSQVNSQTNQRRAIILIVIFVFVLLVSAYLLSPLNQIKQINVYGTDHLSQEQVTQSSGVSLDGPLWETWFDRGYHVRQLINQQDHVQDATISIEDYQTLAIEVSEYDVLAQIEDEPEGTEETSLYNILENAEVTTTDISAISVPLLINFKLDDERFDMMVEELKDTNSSVLALISEIELLDIERNPRLLKLNMNDGNQVLINIPYFANRINYYPLLADAVDNQRGQFDLEAGAFFTPYKSQPQDELNQVNEEMEEGQIPDSQAQTAGQEAVSGGDEE